MIMTDEVRKALQTLRDNATNDFERHRIDVLERDLTDPPKVEIVDDKHQRFLGINFRKRKEGHYFTPMLSIYRAVWQYYYGEVPPNTIIHHIDHNKDNNDISNLIPMLPIDHRRHHAKNNVPPKLQVTLTCSVCGKTYTGIYTGHNLYCPDCRKEREREKKRAREKAREKAEKKKKARVHECVICGKVFPLKPKDSMTHGRKTCSPKCEKALRKLQADARRVARLKVCVVCGETFEYKKKRQKCCSPECGAKLNGLNSRGKFIGELVERVISHCELCGKEIRHLPSKKPRFCSRDCVYKYMAQRKTKTEHVSQKEIRQCVVCGKSFKCCKTARKTWCSPECRRKLNMKPCAVCGKMFYPRLPTSTTCSNSCKYIYRREIFR